jgi:hypothetical protein
MTCQRNLHAVRCSLSLLEKEGFETWITGESSPESQALGHESPSGKGATRKENSQSPRMAAAVRYFRAQIEVELKRPEIVEFSRIVA